MKKLNQLSPIWHAVVWIIAYVVFVWVGDSLSELVGEPNSVTAPLLFVLSIALLLYVSRNGWRRYYGLRRVERADFTKTLLYLPLLAIVLMQLPKGWRDDLDLTAALLIVALMACVGFIEELIFRGFLFRAILTKSTLTRAIVISGVTFGIGHVVNLARGYSGAQQIVQTGFGVVLGIVLALLFAVTGTIVPLIVFHTFLNISGSVTAPDTGYDMTMLVVTAVISIGYAVYLVSGLRRQGPGTGNATHRRARSWPLLVITVQAARQCGQRNARQRRSGSARRARSARPATGPGQLRSENYFDSRPACAHHRAKRQRRDRGRIFLPVPQSVHESAR